jgi:hypothetical protein
VLFLLLPLFLVLLGEDVDEEGQSQLKKKPTAKSKSIGRTTSMLRERVANTNTLDYKTCTSRLKHRKTKQLVANSSSSTRAVNYVVIDAGQQPVENPYSTVQVYVKCWGRVGRAPLVRLTLFSTNSVLQYVLKCAVLVRYRLLLLPVHHLLGTT